MKKTATFTLNEDEIIFLHDILVSDYTVASSEYSRLWLKGLFSGKPSENLAAFKYKVDNLSVLKSSVQSAISAMYHDGEVPGDFYPF